MKRRHIKPMSIAELEALPTKRLLARLKQLLSCEESLSLSDTSDQPASARGIFKDSPEWISAYEQLKAVLSKREHIPKTATKQMSHVRSSLRRRDARALGGRT